MRLLLIAAVCQLCLHYADLYDLRTSATAASCSFGCFRRSAPPR